MSDWLFLVYVAIGIRVGYGVALHLARHDSLFDDDDTETLVLLGIIGLCAGVVWPGTLIALGIGHAVRNALTADRRNDRSAS